MAKRSDIAVGQVFGCRTIIEELPRAKWDRMFLVSCTCGQHHVLPLKEIKKERLCGAQHIQADSTVYKIIQHFPGTCSSVKRSKIYELWIWLRREKHAPLCPEWRDDIIQFIYDFAELMGGEPTDYLKPRNSPVYYTMERINKDGIWEKSNVTVRKFFTERAFHRDTYRYWRLLGGRGLLEDDLLNDYIKFTLTFGEKQVGYVLRRRDRRRLHSRDNSYWFRFSKLAVHSDSI